MKGLSFHLSLSLSLSAYLCTDERHNQPTAGFTADFQRRILHVGVQTLYPRIQKQPQSAASRSNLGTEALEQ